MSDKKREATLTTCKCPLCGTPSADMTVNHMPWPYFCPKEWELFADEVLTCTCGRESRWWGLGETTIPATIESFDFGEFYT